MGLKKGPFGCMAEKSVKRSLKAYKKLCARRVKEVDDVAHNPVKFSEVNERNVPETEVTKGILVQKWQRKCRRTV